MGFIFCAHQTAYKTAAQPLLGFGTLLTGSLHVMRGSLAAPPSFEHEGCVQQAG